MFLNKEIYIKAQNKANIIYRNNIENYFNIIKNEFLCIWKDALEDDYVIIDDNLIENNTFCFREFKPFFDKNCVIIDEFSIKITKIYSQEFSIYDKITPIILYTTNKNTDFIDLSFEDIKTKIIENTYKFVYTKNEKIFEMDKNNILDNYLLKFDMATTLSAIGRKFFREVILDFNGKNIMKYL